MNTDDTKNASFDDILDSIRTDEIPHAEIAAAADRVRGKLGLAAAPAGSSIHIESCSGFQALIPAFLAGTLPRETALLLEDHSRECIPCRRALIAARTPRAVPAVGEADRKARPPYARWAAAAAVAAVAVLGAYTAWQAMPFFGGDPQLKVMRVDGNVYQLASGAPVPLRAGMTVSAKNAVRTAKDSGALLMMDDGSRIEMRDRTELTVANRRDGSTVRLDGGAIIVEASPQGSGHLDVRTSDCLVAVKGTIFAVNTGTKGSRVSVVEGAVRVAADGRESLLKPGDQMTTSGAVQTVAVGDEIAWSKDSARYAQLLNELASLRKDLDARVHDPDLRYGSRLLDRLPKGTIVYAAIPNLTDALLTAKTVFEEHVAQSGALQTWWNEHMSSPEHRKNMDEAFEKVKVLGSQLGDEIVIALVQSPGGGVRGPILMAEVKDRSQFRRTLANEMKEMEGPRPDASVKFDGSIVRIEFAHHPDSGSHTATADAPAWEDSPFRAKLSEAYADGTSWLFGVDLKAMLSHVADEAPGGDGHRQVTRERLDSMGFSDAEYLIFERTANADGAKLHAEVSFDQPRRGIAGWLATPAPMGAAEFVSPDAAFAAAAAMKRPEALLADALSWIAPETDSHLTDNDLEPLRGLAATLGGDVAIALDGPVLPIPSWKVAIEVYDPARFQTEFASLVSTINTRLAADYVEGRLVVETEAAGNRTDWVVRYTGPETVAGAGSMRYTIVDGYLIAAPSRVLIDRAIEQRGNGYTLTRSSAFAALLPADGHVNLSAFVWQHLGPTLGPLASKISGALASDEMKALEAMAGESRPRLVTVYAEDNLIVVNSRGDAGLGSMLGSIMSAHGLGVLGHALDRAREAGDAAPQ
jgi:ferric-dicitrate binding protein FerR (iron transport regulator)